MSDSGLLAPPVSVLIVSCSLDPLSQSRLLALDAALRLEDRGACVEVMDLQEMQLPGFDNANPMTIGVWLG
jgi:NAD(P)H-dependent FMN reductase